MMYDPSKPRDLLCLCCNKYNFPNNRECYKCGTPFPKTSQPLMKAPQHRCPLDWIYCNGSCLDPLIPLYDNNVMEEIFGGPETVKLPQQPRKVIVYDQKWKEETDLGLASLGLLSQWIITNYNKKEEIKKKIELKREEKKIEKLTARAKRYQNASPQGSPVNPKSDQQSGRRYVHVESLENCGFDDDDFDYTLFDGPTTKKDTVKIIGNYPMPQFKVVKRDYITPKGKSKTEDGFIVDDEMDHLQRALELSSLEYSIQQDEELALQLQCELTNETNWDYTIPAYSSDENDTGPSQIDTLDNSAKDSLDTTSTKTDWPELYHTPSSAPIKPLSKATKPDWPELQSNSTATSKKPKSNSEADWPELYPTPSSNKTQPKPPKQKQDWPELPTPSTPTINNKPQPKSSKSDWPELISTVEVKKNPPSKTEWPSLEKKPTPQGQYKPQNSWNSQKNTTTPTLPKNTNKKNKAHKY
eukprot:TRINITY_DN12207_c0_g1_i1.p1 TRINITY_DN12207_c0_g1~~TRINITY_DN12207_c0_g1_i1.p1  ORF type:complete len:470 (-),score=143.52 TRINITY_DN12207_c0_g1_i1:71-1480(-)